MPRYLSILVAISLLIISSTCSNNKSQMGGIVGEVRFNTQACVPQQKIISIRNDDISNPQRVMGVYFELGTNKDSNFKIEKVVVGSSEYEASASFIEDVLIPAGGIMAIHTSYNPKNPTRSSPHVSYLDLFLNGPRLGIIQIKMMGDAAPSDQSCTGGESFKIDKIKITIKAPPALPEFIYEVPSTEITKPFIISGSGDNKQILKENFPVFAIKGTVIEARAGSNGLRVNIAEDTRVSFNGTEFNVENITFKTEPGNISVSGKWTSGESSVDGDLADLTLPGISLQAGKIKLVFTAELNSDLLGELNGGVVGFEMELTKQ